MNWWCVSYRKGGLMNTCMPLTPACPPLLTTSPHCHVHTRPAPKCLLLDALVVTVIQVHAGIQLLSAPGGANRNHGLRNGLEPVACMDG